jgi:hypothetical protein
LLEHPLRYDNITLEIVNEFTYNPDPATVDNRNNPETVVVPAEYAKFVNLVCKVVIFEFDVVKEDVNVPI